MAETDFSTTFGCVHKEVNNEVKSVGGTRLDTARACTYEIARTDYTRNSLRFLETEGTSARTNLKRGVITHTDRAHI
jgi:hypothetical protein